MDLSKYEAPGGFTFDAGGSVVPLPDIDALFPPPHFRLEDDGSLTEMQHGIWAVARRQSAMPPRPDPRGIDGAPVEDRIAYFEAAARHRVAEARAFESDGDEARAASKWDAAEKDAQAVEDIRAGRPHRTDQG